MEGFEQNQPESDYKRAAIVARNVQLLDVYLSSLETGLEADRQVVLHHDDWSVDVGHSEDFSLSREQSLLTVRAQLRLAISGNHGEKEVDALRLRALFHLEYEIRLEGAPDDDELQPLLQSFARVNGIYNAWPYFRELAQTTTARMGIPPIVLPVYRVSDQVDRSEDKKG